jgi:hypothetical protein
MFMLIFSGPIVAMVLERPDARMDKTSHPNRIKTIIFSFNQLSA